MQNVSSNVMILKSTDGPNNENVEPRREYDRENKSCPSAGMAENEGQDSKEDSQKCRYDRSELGTFSERDSDEERPAGQAETKQEMNNDDQSDVGGTEDTEMPDYRDSDPRRQVGE